MSQDVKFKAAKPCDMNAKCFHETFEPKDVYRNLGDSLLYAQFRDGSECACMREVEAV
jgi:hypothetical protein